jgi:hypothetical protein
VVLITERKRKKITEKEKEDIIEEGYGGFCCRILTCAFVENSGVRGGGKCPEEEHTTCSGGPTINCHKRGLRGERKKSEKKKNKNILKKREYFIEEIIKYY